MFRKSLIVAAFLVGTLNLLGGTLAFLPAFGAIDITVGAGLLVAAILAAIANAYGALSRQIALSASSTDAPAGK